MKVISLVLILGFVGNSMQMSQHRDMECGFRSCALELLNFSDISFSTLVHKVQLAAFCIRECSPPVVHEFFESVTFAITKRIAGVCTGNECIDKNRFIALGQCAKNRSWPLIQCGTRIVDLVQLALEPTSAAQYRNKTCTTIHDMTKCIEYNLGKCGEKPMSLFTEIFEDLLEVGLNLFCQISYKEGRIVTLPDDETTTPSGPTIEIPFRKPVAKGYKSRKNGAAGLQISVSALLGSIIAILFTVRAMR